MTPDDLDRILASEEPLEPSSGFAMNVMDAVRRQAAEPPPPPFPWSRFAAGLGACGVMAWTGSLVLPRFAAPLSVPLAALGAIAPQLGYAAAAVILSLGLAALPRLLAHR
jgi:hypothetical protein